MVSQVFTRKFQLRICLRSSKVTFLEGALPGDFRELLWTVFRMLKVQKGPEWPTQLLGPDHGIWKTRGQIYSKSQFFNFWVSQCDQAESDDFKELSWASKRLSRRVLRSIYLKKHLFQLQKVQENQPKNLSQKHAVPRFPGPISGHQAPSEEAIPTLFGLWLSRFFKTLL